MNASSQTTFSDLEHLSKKKVTHREKFLAEMDQVMPWDLMLGIIRPNHQVAGNDRRPMPLETMLRVYCLQQWFVFSYSAMSDST